MRSRRAVFCWMRSVSTGSTIGAHGTGTDPLRSDGPTPAVTGAATDREIPAAKGREGDGPMARIQTFGLSHVPGHGTEWSLHIFDRQTLWEVARL